VEVELKAGEVLFLPAGWFHEVTSYNDESPPNVGSNSEIVGSKRRDDNENKARDKCFLKSELEKGNEKEFGNGHLALNYWFHPPDTDGKLNNGFETPYKSDLWERDFKLWQIMQLNLKIV